MPMLNKKRSRFKFLCVKKVPINEAWWGHQKARLLLENATSESTGQNSGQHFYDSEMKKITPTVNTFFTSLEFLVFFDSVVWIGRKYDSSNLISQGAEKRDTSKSGSF